MSRTRLLDDWPDPADHQARAAFAARYGAPDLGPVAAVIPAYREAATIASVVAGLPDRVGDLAVRALVVVDGQDPGDATARAAAEAGAYVCATPANRGQGAALRLGYHVAVDHGARFLVTLDGDGQYDPAEVATVLGPVLAGEADLVSGSRRLGADRVGDPVRSLGVALFAMAVGVLTGRRVSDPAFGLRAMTAEVAAAVPLRQPQYQAGELLVGTIMAGFAVAERPATIRARTAGRSHKGTNLRYGWRFGRAVLSTWWQARRGTARRDARAAPR